MTEAYIYDAVRTPRGKGRQDGSLHEVTSARLSAGVLNALKARNNLEGHAVEDVIWGNVTQWRRCRLYRGWRRDDGPRCDGQRRRGDRC